MIVVPALLEQEVELQISQLLNLSPYYSRFQIDIADNTLVKNKTTQIDELFQSSFFNIASQVQFDFHLMVSDPMMHIKMLKLLPKKRVGVVLIHYSVFPDFKQVKERYPLVKFGLVLNPEDSVEALKGDVLQQLSAVQIMTIIPGFQGSSFIENSLIKVEQLRERGFQREIMIDGSVNETTVPIILSKKIKPDVLAIGSYLTKSPKKKLGQRVKYLKLVTCLPLVVSKGNL